MEKKININTGLLAVLTLISSIAGWGMNHAISGLERSVNELKSDMMPRHEIQIQVESLKQGEARIMTDQLDLRARIQKIEIDVARIQRSAP